ncbi:MAG: 3-methyl-2-oxobutanoate hydroxymethyltransferase [Schwartzia sp.]|nr:3-methyl-2-oxobutanoate hydroxymethyltransferase [Schwartzia sp. (in: firmicutes)]MBO6235615.1 3-methyl-2-oxobutanoate hydroxymethyltransferase [Schwartzia sp. (in: firmicutes)]
MSNQSFTVATFKERKAAKIPVTMLTAYDYSTAKLVEEAGIDTILVGDSLGNVMLGYGSTLPVTVEDMIHHGKAVVRGAKNTFVVVDMPFMSYQVSAEKAVENAGRIMKETGCQAVKLEGGIEILSGIEKMIAAGIPVVGHLGLTPQSVNQLGGYKVQGKDAATAQKLIDDAKALDEAGCCAIVLECVPARLAEKVTASVEAVTIGIGAGSGCDGQVLVVNDMLGFTNGFKPKFVKCFANIHDEIIKAMKGYKDEVTARTFPEEGTHTFKIAEETLEKLY